LLLDEITRSLQDVGIELRRIRLGVVGGEFRRFVDDGTPSRHHFTARSPAALTARTSMPSTCSPGISKDWPRSERLVVAEARATEVPMPY